MAFLPPNQQHQSTEGNNNKWPNNFDKRLHGPTLVTPQQVSVIVKPRFRCDALSLDNGNKKRKKCHRKLPNCNNITEHLEAV